MAIWTPWGTGQYTEKVARGVAFVGTAGHGGYRVANKTLDREALKSGVSYRCTHRGKDYTWFEEDCEWAFVALIFPNLFKPELVEEAKKMVNRHWPELYTNHLDKVA